MVRPNQPEPRAGGDPTPAPDTDDVRPPPRAGRKPPEARSGRRLDGGSAAPSRLPHIAAVGVLVAGLLVTATLTVVTSVVHNNNEKRLLRQRAAEVAAVLGAAIPNVQTPLVSAGVVANATNADHSEVAGVLSPLFASRRFVSASLWPTRAPDPMPIQVFGPPSELSTMSSEARRTMVSNAVSRSPTMSIVDMLDRADRRIGYAYSAGRDAKYVVYGEASLPANRRARVDTNAAFAGVDYAIYLGRDASSTHLIAASVSDPDFRGRVAASNVDFGDNTLHVVLTPHGELGGTLLPRLPWLIAVTGTIITIAAALMTERLVRRRGDAELLALEHAQLFREQRNVSQTLQHSLLPDRLPEIEGLDVSVRYSPGTDGVDIGGDWYDVIVMDDDHVLFVVGDVSGRGLKAATVMASLRYAIRAYAAQGDEPAAILNKLSSIVSVERDRHFATVLCGLVDVATRRVTTSNAGHPNPLVITGREADFLATTVGPPIGVDSATYTSTDATVPAGATLVGYTDGLYERRREHPDVGLDRLRQAAVGFDSLDALLDGLLDKMAPGGGQDDTAILGIRWRE